MIQRMLVLAFILGCLGMQVYQFFVWKHFYPFVDYSMYCSSSQPPVEAAKRYMYVRLPDHRQVEVSPAYMGLNWHAWWNELAKPLVLDPPDDPVKAADHHKRRLRAAERITQQVQVREEIAPVRIEVLLRRYRIEEGTIYTGIDSLSVNLPLPTEAQP